MLDGSVYSVTLLWGWISTRAAELRVSYVPGLTQQRSGPSHLAVLGSARPALGLAPTGRDQLLGGWRASYLGQLLRAAVPAAPWVVGEHQIASHPLRNRPMITTDHYQVFLLAFPFYGAYQSTHGLPPMSGTDFLAPARRTINALNGEVAESADLAGPMVTVVAEVDCFDVGLREDIVEHPGLVEHLMRELADRVGVVSVHRYGPAVLTVNFRDWDELQLKLWCDLWLERHLPR